MCLWSYLGFIFYFILNGKYLKINEYLFSMLPYGFIVHSSLGYKNNWCVIFTNVKVSTKKPENWIFLYQYKIWGYILRKRRENVISTTISIKLRRDTISNLVFKIIRIFMLSWTCSYRESNEFFKELIFKCVMISWLRCFLRGALRSNFSTIFSLAIGLG